MFPATDDVGADRDTLNTPHDGRLTPKADGQGYHLTYAHTGGVGDEYDIELIGSVGVAELSSLRAQPIYLADLFLDGSRGDEPLRAVTSVDWHKEGWFAASDSDSLWRPGGQGQGRVMMFDLPTLQPTGKPGSWSPSNEQMALVSIDDALRSTYGCSGDQAYQIQWRDEIDIGSVLRAPTEGLAGSCEAE